MPSEQSAPRRRRGLRSPLPMAALFAVVVAAVGAAGIIRAADVRTEQIDRIDGLSEVLSLPDEAFGPSENYLLVGSDTREGVDPDAPNIGAIGTTDDVQGQRADTIMILRRDEDGGVALTSLPRDLWVRISGAGRSDRINSAFVEGPERLASTITEDLGIPIHHYVEVDFMGFEQIIDATGGVEMCIEHPTRDRNSGLDLQPGCQMLDGSQALAFSRSRYYEEFRDGEWRMDPTSDLGRIRRQQLFMRAAINNTLETWRSSPFSSSQLLEAVIGSVRIDPGLDPFRAAESLRRAAEEDLTTHVLPVVGLTIDGKAVLELDDGAEVILDYFRGLGPPPPTESDADGEG